MGGAQPVDLSSVAGRIAVQDVLGRRQRRAAGFDDEGSGAAQAEAPPTARIFQPESPRKMILFSGPNRPDFKRLLARYSLR